MLELNVITVEESDYASPMVLVEAPVRDPRPCIDYRKLNSITRVEYCVPYLDDIAIFSENWGDHLKHLHRELRKLSEAKLKIKHSKYKFAQNEVK